MHDFFPTKKHLALEGGKLNYESPGASRESLQLCQLILHHIDFSFRRSAAGISLLSIR